MLELPADSSRPSAALRTQPAKLLNMGCGAPTQLLDNAWGSIIPASNSQNRIGNMRNIALTVAILWGGLAHAIQPVEAGLQPLLDRHRGIQCEQQKLNDLLESATTEPEARAAAYRQYVRIDLERQALEREIKNARSWAASPLVRYAIPANDCEKIKRAAQKDLEIKKPG